MSDSIVLIIGIHVNKADELSYVNNFNYVNYETSH
jgi:hypothetical protein